MTRRSARDRLFFLACDDMPVTSDEVNEAIDAFAHELAQKIRNTPSPDVLDDYGGLVDHGADWAADLIDPKEESSE